MGRGEAFTRHAFRDAFQHGRDLGNTEQVLRAAERAGLDPRAARAATEDPQVKQALRAATDAAHVHGVIGVPTLAVGAQLSWGDDRLTDGRGAGGISRASRTPSLRDPRRLTG